METVQFRDPRPVFTVELPSTKGSKIELWASLLVKDIANVDPNSGVVKQGISALPLYIKSWNITDENGVLFPINEKTIDMLPVDDAIFLLDSVKKFSEEQKKSS